MKIENSMKLAHFEEIKNLIELSESKAFCS